MIESFKDDIVKILFNIKIQTMSPKEFEEHKKRREQNKANQSWLGSSKVSIETSSLAHLKKSILLQPLEQKGLNLESISTIFLQLGQVKLTFLLIG